MVNRRLVAQLASGLSVVSGIAVAFIPCPVAMDPFGDPPSYFIVLSWDALPAAFFGIAISFLVTPRNSMAVSICAVLVFAGTLVAMLIRGAHPFSASVAGASLLVASLWWIPQRWPKWAAQAGAWSFGIYVAHVAFVEVLQVALSAASMPVSLGRDAVVATLAIGGSLGVCALAQRYAALRWLLPA